MEMAAIAPIPEAARNLRGADFCLLWAGAAVSLAEIWAGGLLAPLGLLAGGAAILLGHLIGNTPLALAGVIGTRTGLPTMVATRPALGVRGSYLPTVLNIVQLVGWTGVMLWIGGRAAQAMAPLPGDRGAAGWIAISGALTTAWALLGHRHWRWLQRVAVTVLVALCVLMTVVLLERHQLARLLAPSPSGGLPFMVALDLVIAMPISWLPLVCDYSRYARSARSAFWGTWVGYLVVSSWMYGIGLAAALATGSATPDSMVLELMAGLGLALPALLIVLLSTFTTTFLDVYSAAVSSLNLWPRLDERAASATCGALGTALALVLPASAFEDFLLLIGALFSPLFGVVLSDFLLGGRERYLAAGDPARAGGPVAGFDARGLAAWAIGAAAYFALQHLTTWGASLPSLLLAGLVYAVLRRRGARSPRPSRLPLARHGGPPR